MHDRKTAHKTTVGVFFDHLASSGLLSERVIARYRKDAQNRKLVQQMIADGVLTAFQARHLVSGRCRDRGFFIDDKYKIVDSIGRGGTARVLLCEHLKLERFVAIKVMDRSLEKRPGAVERFMREARTAAKFDHPHVGRVFDVDVSSMGPYLVMEYIDGANLQEFVKTHGPLSPAEAAAYLRQAAIGLQQAHLARLVHRDIKPSNLMLDRSGVVKLLDLGLARTFDEQQDEGGLTQQYDPGAILGTADFIAPEQAMESGRADIRSDIYSLGCSAYFFLTGALPTGSGTVMQKLLRHQSEEPRPIASLRSDVPAELIEIVDRMMKKSPADRYQSPLEVIAALTPLTAIEVPPPPSEKMPPPRAVNFQFGLSASPGSLARLQDRRGEGSSLSGHLDLPSWVGVASETMTGKLSSTSKMVPEMAMASDVIVPSPDVDEPAEAHAAVSGAAVPALSISEALSESLRTSSGTGTLKVVGISAGAVLAMMLVAFGIWSWFPGPSPDSLPPPPASGVAGPPPSAPATMLRAGGTSFVKPIMDHWTTIYEKKSGCRLDYVSKGSSKGVEGVILQFLDFGCSDAPLTDAQIAETGGTMLHVPLVMGAVVPICNVANFDGPPLRIQFTGPLLADIFLGKVVRWNDPGIAASNPDVALPDLPITVVARKDDSGTTNLWTDYLSKVSNDWKAKVGVGNTVSWPVGVQVRKNNGVADLVSRTNGGIGYVDLSYALATSLSHSAVCNRHGVYVEASATSITAAAAAPPQPIPADFRYSLTDSPGADAFPIVGTCWAIFSVDLDPDKREDVIDFLTWATGEGQSHVATLHYGALPSHLVAKIAEALLKAR
jgi:phosphate ABC transporter phosphate-binding protein